MFEYREPVARPANSLGKGERSRNLNALVQVVRSAYHYEWIATSLARASNWFDH